MVEPAFEESIGFVARAMKNFGVRDLRLINPIATLAVQGRMRAGHAQEVLDSVIIDRSLTEALHGADLSVATTAQRAHSNKNLLRRPLTPKELSGVLDDVDGTVAVVFGREGTGLNSREIGSCDLTLTIPASSEYPTLNLSHAFAIIFYELFRRASSAANDDLANDDVKEKILEFLSDSAAAAGLEEYKIGLAVRALRNVLGRAAIRRREGSLLAGVLRQVSEVLRNAEEASFEGSLHSRSALQMEIEG